jgi:hypothetical protein
MRINAFSNAIKRVFNVLNRAPTSSIELQIELQQLELLSKNALNYNIGKHANEHNSQLPMAPIAITLIDGYY